MAVPDLVAALCKAIRVWTFAPSNGSNYFPNPVHRVSMRWDTDPPVIRLDTTGVGGLSRSRAVEIDLSFATIDLLFDLKISYTEALHAKIREAARALLDLDADAHEWTVRQAKYRLREMLDQAGKLKSED
jgi:hypothetical protein